jgi:acid phosphatase
MKKLAILATILILSGGFVLHWAGGAATPATPKTITLPWPDGLPVYDHIVIVVEENKGYDQIIHNEDADYINNVLKAEGASFTQMYAEEHPSEGNYFWLFSGSNQTIGFSDRVPSAKNNPNYPFQAPNLGQGLINKGLSFKGYAESLPAIGSTVSGTTRARGVQVYARKHVPWISFGNVPNGTTVETSSNLRFADFPTDSAQYHTLPTLAFVVPNQDNDMHNGKPRDSIPAGDRWLKNHLDAYYQWAKQNNSLLILTFDENDDSTEKQNYQGLTNPLVRPDDGYKKEIQNRIATIFAGARIKPGDYPEGKGITHVNILRTLEAMYGLPKAGAQQPNAAGYGISDDYLITDVFTKQ